ncbi:hypothetical protein [Deinococcus cellulosilyticus]|uniref:Uncharacterized protein n=1 Tax=Deinococcus cellulosilyticus (strain DSM 18568 / NBRC 106333 / KACC 11606 / 5516J-15) TaxID=1223518 RepID=A0A511N942_DEIC1|nr:hypothetical protein [Deinococcus cellulosilyticus]GEM49006.1 hypothetical protein DC3_46410 [Deinococcus cellulosilyticus NBRC 106333 = KACC 11606]
MKKSLAFALLLLSTSQAQNIRQLGMGGVLLPEQDVAYHNPAFYGFERYDVDTSYAFPLGALQAYRMSQQSNSGTTDLLMFDKVFHPLEWSFAVGHENVIPNDGSANARFFTWADGWNASQHNHTLIPFDLAFSVAPSWYLDVTPSIRAYVGDLKFSDNYREVPEGGKLKPNQVYTGAFEGGYRSSIDAGVSYLPVLSEEQDMKLYGGVRNRFSLGLLRVQGSVQDRTVTDINGDRVDALSSSKAELFANVDPYRPGFGVHLDAGLMANMKDFTFGVGVRNLLQYEAWQGSRSVTEGNKTTTSHATFVEPIFAPEVLLNAAYELPSGDSKWILGADTAFGVNQDLALHVGAEYQNGSMQYRAGVGYEKGLQIGVGLGADLGDHFKVDLALTGHQAVITRQFVVGVAVGAKIKF